MRHFSIRRLSVALGVLSVVTTALFGSVLLAQSDTTTPIGYLTPLVYRMEIEGAIGAVSDNRIEDAIKLAEDNSAELLIIVLDTPGGGLKSTWSICKRILNSRVPICVYIAPSGARAGSAGVFIAYSAHFAAMAPSTNIGAAHPVSGEGKIPDTLMSGPWRSVRDLSGAQGSGFGCRVPGGREGQGPGFSAVIDSRRQGGL